MGRAGAKKICPLVGPGLNSGRIFVSKARYFGPKLAGFCGPKNRLKSRFWLAQSPHKAQKIRPGRPGSGPRAQKFCPKLGQKTGRAGPKWSPLDGEYLYPFIRTIYNFKCLNNGVKKVKVIRILTYVSYS